VVLGNVYTKLIYLCVLFLFGGFLWGGLVFLIFLGIIVLVVS